MNDCPIESMDRVMAFNARDWSTDKSDAWLYGIVCGWDDASLSELKLEHGWSDESVNKLKRMHKKLWHYKEQDW